VPRELVAATTDYGLAFPSVLIHGSLAAVQFHPEKSGRWGLKLLENFVRWSSDAGQAAVVEHVSDSQR
jgi:glutamine amidotransferase